MTWTTSASWFSKSKSYRSDFSECLSAILLRNSRAQTFKNLHILSPYHAKCNLIRTTFNATYTRMDIETNFGLEMLNNCYGLVSCCQRLEHNMIIFTAGWWPLDRRPVNLDSLLDSVWDLYIMLTRARWNSIIIASKNYINRITDFCPSSSAIIYRFRREINW